MTDLIYNAESRLNRIGEIVAELDANMVSNRNSDVADLSSVHEALQSVSRHVELALQDFHASAPIQSEQESTTLSATTPSIPFLPPPIEPLENANHPAETNPLALPLRLSNHQDAALADMIVEHSNDGVVVLKDSKCIFANPMAGRLFCCKPEEFCNRNFREVAQETFGVDQAWFEHIHNQIATDAVVEREVKQQGENGNSWCALTFRKFKSGDEDQILVIARDISKRKSYELELGRNHDFLHNTINAIPEPLAVKSADLEIVLVNDSFCETHGIQRHDVVGKPIQDALPAAYSPEAADGERQVISTGRQQATMESFFNTDGEQFILSTYRSAFRDQISGEPYVVSSSRDVTSEMKRENRLRLLASVFENAQEGVAILSPEGAICEANPEFIATIGKSHAKVLGTCLSTVVNWEHHDFEEILEVCQTGQPWFGNVNLYNKRGEDIACWLSISPSKNIAGVTTNLIAMFSDITQIENTRRELHRQALHDNLTDLPNRRFFRQKIVELIESDRKGELRFGVCFLDLDDFKIVNDTLGHDVGDQLLVEVSNRVKKTLGQECFMARFGGDEFALLIPELPGKPLRAYENSKSVVAALSQPFDLAGHSVHIGVSIGTTVYPDHANDVESLMRHADVAMYKAKEEGKNKVRYFSSELVEIVEKRQAVLSQLRQALDNEELRVVYQPKLCLKEDRILSCEALVRWTMPDGTVVAPSEFIELAEDFGLIGKLGGQVFRTVCQQARAWHDAGILSGPIAVNLSPRQLKESGFFQRFVDIMNETNIEPEWIELEITENAVMEDKDLALDLMHKLNDLGVSIAMDDFGTGYSSLSFIRDFPIRTLKIDTTFVKDLPHCSRAVAIAKTVLSLGHGLNLEVVAEGVETQEQLEFLREAGCDIVQGYLINRPLSGEDYPEFVSRYTDR